MNILVVYSVDYTEGMRNTILESIFCFQDYKDVHFYHYNYHAKMSKMLRFLRRIRFDAVLFHYTFMCDMRWDDKKKYEKALGDFKDCWPDAVKGIIPQDEYYMTSRIREFIRQASVDIVYTPASGRDKQIFYGDYFKDLKIYTVLTGYVDEHTAAKVKKLEKEYEGKERKYAIGYRARNLNYALGEHGNLKVKIADEFNKRLPAYPLITDIKNTSDTKNVFWGDDWYRFLLSCDTVLGCMGGASIIDPEGKVVQLVTQYLRSHPRAEFSEVAEKLLAPYENGINYKAVSPRMFEAAMTKTCQVLVEADYKIMQPGIHYISFKEDFSDFDEVMKKIQDKEYCKRIAQNAYQELIASGKYSYKRYVRKIVKTLKKEVKTGKTGKTGRLKYLRAVLKGYDITLNIYNRLYKLGAGKYWE